MILVFLFSKIYTLINLKEVFIYGITICYFIFLCICNNKKINLKIKIRYSGYQGEKRVSKKLKRISKGRFIILNNILLPFYDGYTQIDHLVITPSGIVCIETKNHGGYILGSEKTTYWTQEIGTQKHKFYNPIIQNNTHCSAIKYILSKERLNVPVYNLVVFSSKDVSVTIQEDNLTVITFKKLKKYFKTLNCQRGNIDVEEVASAIKKYIETNKKVRREYVKYLKEKYS